MAKWYEKDFKNLNEQVTIIKEKRAFIVDVLQLATLIIIAVILFKGS